jgi:hypothetical protein
MSPIVPDRDEGAQLVIIGMIVRADTASHRDLLRVNPLGLSLVIAARRVKNVGLVLVAPKI